MILPTPVEESKNFLPLVKARTASPFLNIGCDSSSKISEIRDHRLKNHYRKTVILRFYRPPSSSSGKEEANAHPEIRAINTYTFSVDTSISHSALGQFSFNSAMIFKVSAVINEVHFIDATTKCCRPRVKQ